MTWEIVVAWAALICGPNGSENCQRYMQKCLVKEYVIQNFDADLAFENCAERGEPGVVK